MKPVSPLRALALATTIAALVSACGGSSEDAAAAPGGSSGAAGAGGEGGGALDGDIPETSADSGGGAGGGADAGAACTGLAGTPGDHNETLTSGGKKRTFKVHVPAGYSASARTMLVLAFHGLGETGSALEKICLMTPVSDAHGFIVVYPDGLGNSWNAGKCCGTPPGQGADDVQFARDLIDYLAAEYCIDARRVYSTGFSNGGMFSQRLACEAADRIAAIGPVSGPIAVDTCTPSRPVPIQEYQGTADIVLPFSGSTPIDQTIAGWVTRDGCTDAQPAQTYQNGDASCVAYTACQGGAAVERCTIQNGGHQWPGGVSTGGIGGNISKDVSASERLYQFFVAHPMP